MPTSRILTAGRFGGGSGAPGVVVTERRPLWLASVLVRRGMIDALVGSVREHFGCDLPRAPRLVSGEGIDFAWSGPGEWLAIAPSAPASLAGCTEGLASMVAQGGGRVVLRVSGPDAAEALAKGLPIDLHPRAFAPGDTALTSVSHIGVQLWQVDEAPSYDIAVPRSFLLSFWRWLAASAAPFGYEVIAG